LSLDAAGALTIQKSKAGTDVNVGAVTGVTLTGLSTKNGDISVQTDGGVLSVSPKGKVTAKGKDAGAGDITLTNDDTAVGTIVFGASSKVTAKAKAIGAGNVTISIGAAGTGTGFAPPNVSITEKNCSNCVRFGTSTITALAPTNKL